MVEGSEQAEPRAEVTHWKIQKKQAEKQRSPKPVWEHLSSRKGTRTQREQFQEANRHRRQTAEKGTRVKKKQGWTRHREKELCQMETGGLKQMGLSQAGLKSYQWRRKQVSPPALHQLVSTPWLRSAKCWLGNRCPLAGRWNMRFHAKLWQSQRCVKKRLRGWEREVHMLSSLMLALLNRVTLPWP